MPKLSQCTILTFASFLGEELANAVLRRSTVLEAQKVNENVLHSTEDVMSRAFPSIYPESGLHFISSMGMNYQLLFTYLLRIT